MDSKKAVIYSAVILLGLLAGSFGPEIYDKTASFVNDITSEPPEKKVYVEGTVISEDPNMTAFREYTPPEEALTFWDIPRQGYSKQYGPWVAATWRYAPNSLLQRIPEQEGGRFIINSGPNGDGNAIQLVDIPADSDTYVYMEGRSASGLILGNQCSEVEGFVGVYRWTGENPEEPFSGENIDWSSVKNKTSTFGVNKTRMKMDIPDRLEGGKIAMFGGVTDRSLCRESPINHLQINRLLVAER